jgi:aromatic ring-opening dioxygenase catalytic subunit (LigB family)
MTGVVAAALVAHVPTLGRPEITPDFQQTLVDGERRLGQALRLSLKPDLWVIASTHWVSTFNWFATCQPMHEGVCVADEAPDLIPGVSYRYRGDSGFAQALVEQWKRSEIPAARNDSPHYGWDYGTWVPLSHLDPDAEVAVVGVPVVLMADHAECLRAGAAIHAVARLLGRRAVFIASSALTHALVRGRHHWPAPERIEADRHFVGQIKRGEIAAATAEFSEYSRKVVAEMGGRALATFLGVAGAMADGARLEGRQYGEYAQSSGSGNANLLLCPADTLAAVQ